MSKIQRKKRSPVAVSRKSLAKSSKKPSAKRLLKIDFGDFGLKYELFDNDFTRRWALVVENALKNGRRISNDGNFYGSALRTEKELREEMARCIYIVNSHSLVDGTKVKKIELPVFPNMPARISDVASRGL